LTGRPGYGRLECPLPRLEVGEPFDQVWVDLGLSIEPEDMPKLQVKYEADVLLVMLC